jgi:deazaflavin-dependent oxidoreductase (nitroreductase family)
VPIPKAVARFNLKVTNPILGRMAWWAPGFAILTHVGRTSGTVRRTPLNIFRRGDRYVIALTYGADAQWVKNVLAAGGCEIETRRRHVRLVAPELVHDPSHRLMPLPVRVVLGLTGVDDFLVLRVATNG